MYQLVLTAALDGDDGGPAQRPRPRGRQPAAQRGVEDFDVGDSPADERATKPADSGFNLG